MRKFFHYLFVACLSLTIAAPLHAQEKSKFTASDWRLGSQAYTFRLFTLEETLQKLQSIGVRYIELFPGQQISRADSATTHFSVGPKERKRIKDLLKKYGITAVCYGVVTGTNEKEWRQIFSFAQEIGVEHINTEPSFGQLKLLDNLCNEYGIKAALHNHPVPSIYWHPTIILNQIRERSNMIGVCGDIGHWVRSGLDPIECIRALEGRILGFHFKDLNTFGNRNAHDVPWGTGVNNMAGVLNELARQGFKGYFSVEYEYKWENNLPEVAESVAYFNRVVSRIANGQ